MFGTRASVGTKVVETPPSCFRVAAFAVVVLVVVGLSVGTAGAQTAITDCKDGDTDAFIDSPGSYELQNDVTNDSNCVEIVADDVIFDGAGKAITASGSPGENAVVAENAENVTVTDFRADGWDGNGGGAVRLFNVTDGEVSSVGSANSQVPFRVDSSSDVDIADNTASDTTGDSIRVVGDSSDVTVAGNEVTDAGESAIDLQPSSPPTERFVVRDNTFDGSAGGTSITAIREETLFVNNTLLNSGDHGVYVQGASDTVVRDNKITNSDDRGIYLLDSSTGVTVEDNEVVDSGTQSLRIESGSDETTVRDNVFESNGGGVSSVDVISDRNVLYNNTVFDNDDNGFFVEGDSNVIRDNNVTSTQTVGIWLRSPSSNTTVEDNSVTDTGNDGIRMDSSENTVVDNEVTGVGSGNTGIAITDGSATSNLIADNTVFDNYQGMFVEGEDHIIQENTVTGSNGGSDGNGVLITSSASNATVDDNVFSNNDNDGVKIEDSSDHTVTDNTANGNGASGVATVGSSSSNTIEKNAADGNRDGIFIDGADNAVLSNTAENNNEAGIEIRPGASGTTLVGNTVRGNTLDFQLEGSVDNTVESLTVGPPASDATVDFDAKDVEVDGVASPPADQSNKQNIGSYVEATGTASDSFLNLTFRYTNAEASGVDETTLTVWEYDGSWTELPSNLDVGANTVSTDISSFSVFAPLGDPSCVDRRSISRGQEGQGCTNDRDISRGESREELDIGEDRDSDTRRRDRSRGERSARDRGRSR